MDRQQPHAEDEIYVVLRGRSRFSAGADVRVGAPTDVIYAPAGVDHRFHDITEDLELIVVFAPPETPTG